MMLGLRDVFQYLECDACGCLQLLNPPEEMGHYYPAEYSAYHAVRSPRIFLQRKIRHYLRQRRNRGVFEGKFWLDRFLAGWHKYPLLETFAHMRPDRSARILDVGCGSGVLLADLKQLGYKNLLGIDRFVPQSIEYGDGVKVVKGTLEDLVGTTWDVIMFHHSLEHMPNPAKVLRLATDLLAPGGQCLVRIPLVAWAWEYYGINWVQIDAPRHLFLHTERSFRLLANAAGLRVHEVRYDSVAFQFWASELYTQNVALKDVKPSAIFSRSKLRSWGSQADALNAESRGDQAAFYLRAL
jgi:SAM-dependent methyltransferase